MTDKNVVNTVDMNNRQIIINKFLNLQSKLIKKQHQTGKKINGKRAFVNFLLPNLNNKKVIDNNNSSYWQNLYQEIQSKPVEEYTVDDIVFENTDYLLEYQIVNQSLKTKLRITIQSCFNINNQTLYSNLILDIWGLNDIKAIQNQINVLNNKQTTQEIFKKHNIQVIENTITDEQQNIVFQLKQNPIINVDDNDDWKYNSTIQFNIIQDTQFLNKFDITKILSKVELDILSKLDKNSNQSIIHSTYQDFFQKFNVDDFFVLNQTDNLIDIHVTYLDLFWYQKRIRYDVQKNWIDYAQLGNSDRTENNESILHHMFDNHYYQTHSNLQDNYDDFKNKLDKLSQTSFSLKDLCELISEQVRVNIYVPLKSSVYVESKIMENGGLYGYRSILNNMKNNSYLNYLLLSSLSQKHKQGINRCKLFYYYVLFFNPEFKNLWNSGLLQINPNIAPEEYFYSMFNLFSLVNQKYPNLIKNLDKYLKENKGLFPIIIYHPVSEINNDPNNLLSYKKNKLLFDSKNQFHLLNKKKSSLLTKLYLFCLSKHNNDLSKNCIFHNDESVITDTYYPNYEIDGNIHRIYAHCLKTTYQFEEERKNNLLLNLFWKMISGNQVSNRQIYFALSLCVKLFIFNFNRIEQMFGYQTTKLMLDIVSLHFYKQILLIIQNKTDWRSSFHAICNRNHLCSSLNRDAFIFYDFLVDMYSKYQDCNKLQSIVDKSHYKVKLDFINHYEESVQKCLTADMENNAFIINLINSGLDDVSLDTKEMLIFAFDKKLKLFPNSTFESIREYINSINQFHLRQEQIKQHQVRYFQYSSYGYQEHQFKLETINMGEVCFEPILNSGRLIEEGIQMEHCVASYDYQIINDKFLVFHITDKTSYPSESLGEPHALPDLTLGLSLNKNLFNLVISTSPNLNNINHSDSFVKFNQCYGYKNAIIANPEQNKNIELLVNKLIEQLNQQLVNIIKVHQQTNFNHNK